MRQAEEAAAKYHEILLALHKENLKSGVSVKLTALGLQISGLPVEKADSVAAYSGRV